MRFRLLVLFLAMPFSLCAVAAEFTLCPSAPSVIYRHDVGVLVVPLPPLASWLGATVVEAPDGLITITRGKVVFRCRVGDTAATVDGTPVTLPLAPYEEFGVIHVPLGSLIHAWGGTATLNQLPQTTVTSPGTKQKQQVVVTLPDMPPATLYYMIGRSFVDNDLYLTRLVRQPRVASAGLRRYYKPDDGTRPSMRGRDARTPREE